MDRPTLVSMIARLRGCLLQMQHHLDGKLDVDEVEDLKHEIKHLMEKTSFDVQEEDLEDGGFSKHWEFDTRLCELCLEPQKPTPSGWVCGNGHGGANWVHAYSPLLMKAGYENAVQYYGGLELADLQKLVAGGGLIEFVRCKDESHILIIDEEGRLKDLPVNTLATTLVAPEIIQFGGPIVGDALYIAEVRLQDQEEDDD